MERWILDSSGYREGTSHSLRSCPRCAGIWVDRATFEEIVREADRRASTAVPTRLEALPRREIDFNAAEVRYLKCPSCERFMNRRNFGRISGVIVDECSTHGIFLDAGELEAIRTFVKAGGLKVSAAREKAEQDAEARRREVRASPPSSELRGSSALLERRLTWLEFIAWFFFDGVGRR